MFIIGDADEARGLANGLIRKTANMKDLTIEISKKMKTLGSSCKDEDYEKMKDVVDRVSKSMLAHLEDVKRLSDAIKMYADILERN